MIARKYSLVLLAAAFSPLYAQAPNRPLTDLACVEEMAIPDYSGVLRVAWIARAVGSVRVLVTVAPSGSPATIECRVLRACWPRCLSNHLQMPNSPLVVRAK